MPILRTRAAHARSWCAFVVSALLAAPCAAAQRPDSTRRRQRRDSAVVLAPLEVRASIVPAAGPSVGSGVPARITIIGHDQLAAWQPRVVTAALANQPGVSLYDDLGAPSRLSVAMRGFTIGPTVETPAGISVFVDGIRQNEPD